jgi:hypothetical protein
VAARRSWVILATLAVVAVSAAAGVVTWDARVRPPPTAEPAPAWSASLDPPANPVPSAILADSASIQRGLQLAAGMLLIRDGGRSGPWTRAAARSGGGSRPVRTDQAARRW